MENSWNFYEIFERVIIWNVDILYSEPYENSHEKLIKLYWIINECLNRDVLTSTKLNWFYIMRMGDKNISKIFFL